MGKVLAGVLLSAAIVAPVIASASAMDASLVPDGTYVVKVEKVQDPQHALVMMNNGVETTLVAAGGVDFSKVKANETIKISLIKGKVPVYAVQ
ncbi:MAG: hypothetical protein KGN02_10670 [bacterium]|nr:hypothetical protein [bacterium]